jgi:hypothetical protein
MSLSRTIRTRMLEALWIETKNCFARAELGLDGLYGFPDAPNIHAHPIAPDQRITAPRQINISPAPREFRQGIGGVSDSAYDFEILFTFPRELLYYKVGTNTYLDETEALRLYLYAGGSVPNRCGRLADPDHPGTVINQSITRWSEQGWSLAPGNGGAEVPIIVSFATSEDQQGNRV